MIHTQWKPEFESRLRRHQDELKQLHFELYHSNLKAFDAYVEMLYHAWQDRPEALRLLDRARQDDPQWLQDRARVAMPVDVAAFAGTIKGLQARLDYLADCGVRMLHLTNLLRGPRDMEHGAAPTDSHLPPLRTKPEIMVKLFDRSLLPSLRRIRPPHLELPGAARKR